MFSVIPVQQNRGDTHQAARRHQVLLENTVGVSLPYRSEHIPLEINQDQLRHAMDRQETEAVDDDRTADATVAELANGWQGEILHLVPRMVRRVLFQVGRDL